MTMGRKVTIPKWWEAKVDAFGAATGTRASRAAAATDDDRKALVLLLGAAEASVVLPAVVDYKTVARDPRSVNIASSSGDRSYTVEERPDTAHGGYYLFCPCPAWPFQKGKGKDCRHVGIARLQL